MHGLLTVLLLVPLIVIVLPAFAYLAFLTVLAPFGARRRVPAGAALPRFAVLIPAHDEQSVLERLLTSLRQLSYPPDRFDIWVVADNCTDDTAAVARRCGVFALERRDPHHRSKGHALRWLLDELRATGREYDAYVVLDADSTVSSNFLTAMANHLAAGARVAQAYYTVLPVHGSHTELLRQASLALVHYLRPAAKRVLGVSCGLKGNGMCFHRSVIEEFGWPSTGLAEDVEFHLALVAAGIPVAFVPEAVVRAEMPSTLRGARSQNLRWEAGRLATLRGQALPLLCRGVRTGNRLVIDAAVEQILPPLSVPAGLTLIVLGAGLLLGRPLVWLPASALLALLAVHVITALVLARVPIRVYGALVHAPAYIFWKLLIYGHAVFKRQRRWVRTDRVGTG